MDKRVESGSVGKSSFCKQYIKTLFGKELPMDAKYEEGGLEWEAEYLHYLNFSSFRWLISCEGGNCNSAVDTWHNTLLAWSKLTSPVGSTQTLCTSKREALKLHMTYTAFLPEMHNLNLITRKHQINPDWGLFNEIIGPYSSKCQGHEIVRNSSILRLKRHGN